MKVVAGLLCGVFFGAVLMKALPFTDLHPNFLLAAPLACVLCMGVILQPSKILALILFARVLIEPALKAGDNGPGFGLGAVLNLFVVIMTLLLLPRNPSSFFKSPFFRSGMVFLAVGAASVAGMRFAAPAVKMWFVWADYFCLALLPWLVTPALNDKKQWMKILVWSSVLPVLWANGDLLMGGLYYDDAGARVMGSFAHPNILAFYLVFVLAMVLYAWKSRLFQWKISSTLLFALGVNAFILLIATKTRNAWFGAWMLFFVYGVLKERKWAFLCLLMLAAGALIPQVSERLSDLSAYNLRRLNSFAWRLEVWKDAMPLLMERWAFGHGVSTFRTLSQGFVLLAQKEGVDAHNVYLQLAFETGFVGLAAYLSIYYQLIRGLWPAYRSALKNLSQEHAVIIAYTLVYMLNAMADNVFNYSALNWYAWFFWGVAMKAKQFQRRAVTFSAAPGARILPSAKSSLAPVTR